MYANFRFSTGLPSAEARRPPYLTVIEEAFPCETGFRKSTARLRPSCRKLRSLPETSFTLSTRKPLCRSKLIVVKSARGRKSMRTFAEMRCVEGKSSAAMVYFVTSNRGADDCAKLAGWISSSDKSKGTAVTRSFWRRENLLRNLAPPPAPRYFINCSPRPGGHSHSLGP